jgi:hypothetical protein
MKPAILAVSLAAAMTCAAADSGKEMTIRLAVPKQVAADASARASGDASASAPVLMLEGFEVIAGERMTIEVLGPPDPKSKVRPLLAASGLVGSGRSAEAAPAETMDLVVPLNDRASRLLANRDEVTLTLRLRDGRHPLKWKRAYLTSA